MEEEIIDFIVNNWNGFVGILAVIAAGVFFILKNLKILIHALSVFKSERVFETYNNNVRLVNEKSVVYKFKPAILKRDSQDIFNCMRYAYDIESRTNIDTKTINFKLIELPDDDILFSNICRFLDYFKSKNGVKILIFVHKPINEEKGIYTQLKDYVVKSNIPGVKIAT